MIKMIGDEKPGLSITVLGSDGSWPGPGGACSGYLLETLSTSIWVDAGSGTFARLQQHVSVGDIDAVILTHQHADHCFDVSSLYAYGTHGPGFDKPLKVFAAAGVAEAALPGQALEGIFDWRIIGSRMQVVVGDISLSFDQTDHGPPTFAVLATAGDRCLAYSADTGPGWSFSNFGTPIDLALCEAAYPPDQSGNGHLNPRQAAQDARHSGVARLVLTHVRPGTQYLAVESVASEAFGSAVPVAKPGDLYIV